MISSHYSHNVGAEGFARYAHIPLSTWLVVSQEGPPGGKDSLGLTPYFIFLALPDGQPPRVTTISIFWAILASRFPFLAFLQIGQRDSQKSGSLRFKIAIFYPHRTCCFSLIPTLHRAFNKRRLTACRSAAARRAGVRLKQMLGGRPRRPLPFVRPSSLALELLQYASDSGAILLAQARNSA